MTLPVPTAPTCPECGGTDTMVGASGNGLCFTCNATWDPTVVSAMPRPPTVAAVDAAMTAELEAFTAEQNAAVRDYTTELIGGPVTLEGGQRGVAVSFPDADHVEVELGDGRHEIVDFADVQSIGPPPILGNGAGDPPRPGMMWDENPVSGDMEWMDPDVSDDDQDAYAQMVQLTASLLMKAAVASVDTSGDEWHVEATPEGFVPPDLTPFHVLEQAGVMALVSLIVMFKIDPGLIVAGIDGAAVAAIEGDQPEVTK